MNTETIMNFLADNYKWFMIGAGVLLFALIGFLVSGKKKKEDTNSGVTMNQNDFSQMGTLDQNQVVAQATPQFIQNPTPEVQQPVAQPTPAVGVPVAPEPVAPAAPVNDTIFTGAPVNASEPEEEKLVIEAPTGTLNENINMDTLGQENVSQIAPVEEEHVIDNQATLEASVAQPTIQAMNEAPAPMMDMIPPEMPAQPAPQMPAQPVTAPEMPAQPVAAPAMPEMQAPVMAADDVPISMTPEEPVMQTPPTPAPAMPEMVAPTAPVAEVPAYQNNTIQQ